MIPNEPGVLEGSSIYAHSCTTQTDQLPFVPSLLGSFFCGPDYRVERSSFDSFLMLYIRSGRGYAESEGRSCRLGAGDILFLDCYAPHRYGTAAGSHLEFEWMHFDGPMARPYFEKLRRMGQPIRIPDPCTATHSLRRLLHCFEAQEGAPDLLLARYITDLLTDILLAGRHGSTAARQSAAIDESLRYISDHMEQPLSVEQLARQAMLSPFYFSRLFRQETGFTPHRYLIMVRLDYSRYLLRTSDLPLKQIVLRCGLGSTGSFCTSFKKAYGITPQQYRSSV